MKKYMADFETATWFKDRTYVWAWAICEIGKEENIYFGNNIESFMNFCEQSENSTFYFHNLKFDSEFIISHLLQNNYKWIKDKKERDDKTFTTLIGEMNQFYTMEIYFKVRGKNITKAKFIDSLKIIPFSVKEISKAFNLEESKLTLDYKKIRGMNHQLTEDEKAYIKNDVVIVSKALNTLFKENLTKITNGSNALNDFKTILSANRFEHYFPKLDFEVDKDLRKSYKGGFTYLNPIYKEKDVGNGVVLDVNSLYPSIMYEKQLPYGEGIFFEGKYKSDKIYPLFIQMICCSFKIKKNKIPTIQIKNNRLFYKANEYLESSENEIVTLTLTSVDLQLFFEQYDVYELEYICGWKFKAINGIFKDYIDKWIKVKNEATISGNKGQRTLAKLMLNALYGKFATALEITNKVPEIDSNGVVYYVNSEKEIKTGLYLPMGTFITAYAREKTIRTSQAIKDYSLKKYKKDKYIYSDTDSIHCLLSIEELKQFCEIDDVELGKWKVEAQFTKARFLRQKCYIEEINNKLKVTCAGLPKNCADLVNFKNFKVGFKCGGKLLFKHVKRWNNT